MPSQLVVQLANKRAELRRRRAGRRQKRLPNVAPPKLVTLSYARFIRSLLLEASHVVKRRLIPLLDLRSPPRADARMDAKLTPKEKAALKATQEEMADIFDVPSLEPAIRQAGGSVSRAQRKDVLNQLSSGLGFDPVLAEPDVGGMLSDWTSENVKLIQSLPGSYLDDVQAQLALGLEAGDTAGDIADALQERFGVAESRANLIARDQVGKFYGSLNRARQEENGIDSYIWRATEDNRLRDNHAALDGSEQDWDDPPVGGGTSEDEEGHPGSGICCRCHAEPDLGDLLASL